MAPNTFLCHVSSLSGEITIVDFAGNHAEKINSFDPEDHPIWYAQALKDRPGDKVGLFIVEHDDPSGEINPEFTIRDLTDDEWTRLRSGLFLVS